MKLRIIRNGLFAISLVGTAFLAGSCKDRASLPLNLAGSERSMTVFYHKTPAFAGSGIRLNLPYLVRQFKTKYGAAVNFLVPNARPVPRKAQPVDLVILYKGGLSKIETIRKEWESPILQSILEPVAAFSGIPVGINADTTALKNIAIVLESRTASFLRLDREDKLKLLSAEESNFLQQVPLSSISTFLTAAGTTHVIRYIGLSDTSNAVELLLSGKYHKIAGRVERRSMFGLSRATAEDILNQLY